MIYEKYSLRELYPALKDVGFDAKLTLYIPDSPRAENKLPLKRPCVVVCPGGGYGRTVPREAECVAFSFVGREIPVLVVDYSCAPNPDKTPDIRFPIQVQEISCAIAYARANAERFEIDPDKIFVLGFSAGGHAAASVGCFWNKEYAYKPQGLAQGENKPCGMILCYPVITSGEYAHRGSFINLLGRDATPEMLESVSLEKQVSEDTVPTFMWHTCEDELVPLQNTVLFAKALADAKIPFEYHVYPTGPHGMSTATYDSFPPYWDKIRDKVDIEHNGRWIEDAVHWISRF